MRIAITGAQGSGKSTIARRLAGELGLPYISETARGVARALGIECDNPDMPISLRFFWQIGILTSQCQVEKEWGSFVSDRGTTCNAGYFKLLVTRNPGHLSREMIDCYYDIAWEQARWYTHIFYMPATKDGLHEDQFRNVSAGYQKEVDQAMRGVLEDFGLHDKILFVPSDLSWQGKYDWVRSRALWGELV